MEKSKFNKSTNSNWAGIITKEELCRRRQSEEEYWNMSTEERALLWNFIIKGNIKEQLKKAKEEDDKNSNR